MIDAATGSVRTVVGTGQAGFGGDGAQAVDARIRMPRGIALAGESSLYVADSGNHRVRRVNLVSGRIYTLVGGDGPGYAGDGGAAGSATVYGPRGLTVDDDGGLIIADTLNNVLRYVTP
jgi:DNA-binding beta-propeller fold protein YncE